MSLSEEEFDTLYLLVQRPDIALSFDELYNAAWLTEDGEDNRAAAKMGIKSLIDQVNNAKDCPLWIELVQERGYVFRADHEGKKLLRKLQKQRNRLIAAAGVAAALFVVTLTLLLSIYDNNMHIIEDEPVPLAAPYDHMTECECLCECCEDASD